jgi:hypothetical protein
VSVEMTAKQSELERLRAQTNQSPQKAIQEACALSTLVGWGPAQQGAEEKADWKDVLAQSVGAAIKGVPQILKDVQSARDQNQQRAVQQQQRQTVYSRQQPQPGGPPMVGPGGQPASQAPPQRKQWRAPAIPGFGSTPRGVPPEAGDNPYAPPAYAGPPIAHTTPEPERQAQPGQEQQASPHVAPTSAPVPPAYVTQPAPIPTDPAHAPGAPPDDVSFSPEAIGELVQNLEMAVTTGVATPETFAKELVQRLGPGTTGAILENLTADGLCDNIAASKGGVLATHDGRKYIRDLWEEAGKLVGR